MTTGRQLRDQGVANVLAADAAVHRDYGSLVDEAIAYYAARGDEFDAQDVRDRIESLHPDAVAHSPNVLPSAFSHAAKRRLIRKVGYAESQRPSRHAGMIRVWQGAAA